MRFKKDKSLKLSRYKSNHRGARDNQAERKVGSIMKKLLKRVSALAMAATLLMSFTACGSSASGSSGSIAAVKEGANGVKTVTVAILDGMAPYTYQDEKGAFQGYDYEYLKAVDELIPEYEFEYVSASADAAPAAIQAGTYALSCSAHFVTPAREENYLLTIPQSYYPVNLISRTADSYKKFEDLNGKTLVPNPPNDGLSVVLKKMAAQYPDVKYIQEEVSEYIPYADGCKDVVQGKYDCWFGGKSMFDDIMKTEPMELYCSDPVYCAECVAVINKSLTDLRDKMNEATVKLYEDGTLGELSTKWLGEDTFKVAQTTGSLYDYAGYGK